MEILRRTPESDYVRLWTPKSDLGRTIRDSLPYLPAELRAALLDRIASVTVLESSLSLVWFHADGLIEDLGEVSRKVVTTAGVNFLVDAFQNLTEIENFKYHSLGTGTNAEAIGDTGLQTELTTQYPTDNTRATGSLTEGASANIFRTVATNGPLDAGANITEHGIHSAASAGTLWDRSQFAALALNAADSLQSTYDLTCTAGG